MLRLPLVTLLMVFVLTPIGWVRATGSQPQAQDPPAGEDRRAPEAPEPEPDDSDPEASSYILKCSGCHTVGGGKRTGPDLLPSIQWPDDELSAAILRMEKKTGPLSPAEIAGYLRFLRSPDIGKRIQEEQGRAVRRLAAKLDAPSAALGGDLFHGREIFENGGLPCVSCHVIRGWGGTLGPDLTGAFQKLGRLPLISACENASFDVMRTAYRDHPVTKQEALHVTRYLEVVGTEAGESSGLPVTSLGFLAAFVCLVGMSFFYRGRNTGVRAQLIRRANRR